ncbi:MAG: hypothetical protein BA870_12345 [Desulfuromonadales bacterium C00003094]|nr:MAG: hypothetical protein BA870_12345 [Desulfuromonadales bacterium C00003094]
MNFRSIYSEVSTWFKQVFHMKNAWILLPGLIAVLFVYVVHHFNFFPGLNPKGGLEALAIWLVATILLVLLTKSFISRDPLMIYLAVLALVFLVRELDDTVLTVFSDTYRVQSKKLVDLILVGMVLWGLAWHEKIFASLNRFMMLKISIFGVFWTYLFSQIIARRAFRHVLPNERLLHVPLEETAETAAHLFFLFVALCCCYCIPNRNRGSKFRINPANQDSEKGPA